MGKSRNERTVSLRKTSRIIVAVICLGSMLGFARDAIAQAKDRTPPAAMTNQDVISMVKAGLSPDIVAAKIKASSGDFDTSPAALEKMKAAGIPDSVILAMVDVPDKSSKSAAATQSQPSQSEEIPSGKPRVYVSDSQSWLMVGGFGASNGTAAGATRGGSSPQTVELIKTFGQRCPGATVTDDRDRASYVVLFDRESFKSVVARRDKIAIFRRNGDVLFSDSVRSVGNAVKDACEAIQKDLGTKTPE